ncbi:MAG: helix-turn-helix transcriptional regulator [Ignavibacteriales bacterium]|nr:helix-turn-helix transcriptional regulator [Ignavibacteriales bacterium]
MFYPLLRGVSQKGLAGKLNIDPSTLARLERDEGKPSCKLKEKFIEFFKKSRLCNERIEE